MTRYWVRVLDSQTMQEAWRPIGDVVLSNDDRQEPAPPPADPPIDATKPRVIFHEDWSSLSLEDGLKPTWGERWCDCFAGYRVRHLEANNDQCAKIWIPHKTHRLGVMKGRDFAGALPAPRGDTCSLLAWPEQTPGTGLAYTGGMLSAERSLAFTYGTVEFDLCIDAISAGGHFTAWMLRADGVWPPEIDIGEFIGSNQHRPNGPIEAVFFSGKEKAPDAVHNPVLPWLKSMPIVGQWHKYRFIWEPDFMAWEIDGEVVRRQPTFIHEPMTLFFSWEVGASPNGDFPGPVNGSTKWPMSATIGPITVTQPVELVT